MLHHHHYYDENDKPAVIEHDHPCETVRHIEKAVPDGLPIYWDHEGTNCEGEAIRG